MESLRRSSNTTQQSFKDWQLPSLCRQKQKRIRYATSQQLWSVNCSLLMKVLLDNYLIEVRSPEIGHAQQVYVNRLSSVSIPRELAMTPLGQTTRSCNEGTLLRFIMSDEVKVVLKDLKQRSASGPDSMSVVDVNAIGIHALSVMLSCWLAT